MWIASTKTSANAALRAPSLHFYTRLNSLVGTLMKLLLEQGHIVKLLIEQGLLRLPPVSRAMRFSLPLRFSLALRFSLEFASIRLHCGFRLHSLDCAGLDCMEENTKRNMHDNVLV